MAQILWSFTQHSHNSLHQLRLPSRKQNFKREGKNHFQAASKHLRNACLIGEGSATSGEPRRAGSRSGGGMMERAPRQLGVRLKVKGLWGEAEARRLMGMSVCRNGIFSRSSKCARWSALCRWGWVGSIFVLVGGAVCVCVGGEGVKWSGGLEAAKRFMLKWAPAGRLCHVQHFWFALSSPAFISIPKVWSQPVFWLINNRFKVSAEGSEETAGAITSYLPLIWCQINVTQIWRLAPLPRPPTQPRQCNSVDFICYTHGWIEGW